MGLVYRYCNNRLLVPHVCRILGNLFQHIDDLLILDTYELGTVLRCSVLEGVGKQGYLLFGKRYDSVTMRLDVPVPVLILDATTHTMPIMRKASIYRAGVEQIAERSEAR